MPAEVVHAAFYNFADGEAARHMRGASEKITPEASLAARERGGAATVRRIVGDERSHGGPSHVRRAAELAGAE
ncbi:hypothetical protein ABZ345_46265 [Lentzea sp. NPDC005914]|uniref:helix-turn-helix domain-containing protein n=1 Tax=Lentzea sp. NPDC005914 TaxID=3154572 RepID=UPI0033DB4951